MGLDMKLININSFASPYTFPLLMSLFQLAMQASSCLPLCPNNTSLAHISMDFWYRKTSIVNRSEPICTLHSYNETVLSDKIREIIQELDSCERDSRLVSVAAFTELDRNSDSLLRSLASSSFLISHYDIGDYNDTQIREFIRKSYIDLGIRNYIVSTTRSSEVLSLAEAVFVEHRTGKAALMPHKTKWTLVVWSQSQLYGTLERLEHSVFDNVAVWLCAMYNTSGVMEVRTLRWNRDRSRRFDLVRNNSKEKDCQTFPNRNLGLNGRQLHSLSKMYLFQDLIRVVNTTSDKESEISGYFVDVIKLLSLSLNFSYDITMTDAPWANFSAILRQTKADIALALWMPVNQYSDIDVSFPLVFDNIRGFYMERRTPNEVYWPMSTMLLCPFPFPVYIFMLFALTFTIVFYTLVEHAVLMQAKKKTRCEDEHKLSWSNVLSEIFPEVKGPLKTRNSGQQIHSFSVKLFCLSLFKNLCRFMPSILNQGYLPKPQRNSLRYYVISWALFTLCFSAIYTGYLTSKRVRPQDDSYIKTFKEMLQRKDFSWIIVTESTAAGVVKKSNDCIIHELSEVTKHISLRDKMDEEVVKNITSSMKDKHVFIHYGMFAGKFAERVGKKFQFKFIKEKLIALTFGLGLPKNSEINLYLSDKLLEFHEAGIMVEILNRKGFGIDYRKIEFRPEDTSLMVGEKSVQLLDVVAVLFVIACCMGVSFVVLGVEYIVWLCHVMWVIRRASSVRYSHS